MNKLSLFILPMLIAVQSFSQKIERPESIAYDEKNDRYLFSSKELNSLMQMNREGEVNYYVNGGLLGPGGVFIKGDTVFSVSETFIKGFDLDSGDELIHWNISEGEKLNDITCDNEGNAYVSDGRTDRLYKIDIETGDYSIFVSQGIDLNGIFMDIPNNRVLLCGWGDNALIQAVDIHSGKLTTVVKTPIKNIDGMAQDNCGNFYLSSWSWGKIYSYNNNFENPPAIVYENLNGPADISINSKEQLLCIPELSGSKLTFKELGHSCKMPEITFPTENMEVSNKNLKIKWKSVSENSSYIIQLDENKSFSSPVKYESSDTIFQLPTLKLNSTYYLRIRTVTGDGKPVYTQPVKFITTDKTSSYKSKIEGVSVFPNPATNKLFIKGNKRHIAHKIFTFSGNLTAQSNHYCQTIDIRHLNSGLYFIQIEYTDTHAVLKFEKK